MAKERKVPEFSDNDREQIAKIQQDVISRKPADEKMPPPRQMLPSWYAKGGKVGKVNPFGMRNSRPDFAGGGPQGNHKFNFKKGDT